MKPTSVIILAAGIIMLGACKQKRATDDTIMAINYVPPTIQAPIAMEPAETSQTVEWMGQSYVVNIVRTPADSLPMVSNDYGQKYVDNTVTLNIKRPDGSEFLRRTFSKASFRDYLDDDYRRNGILTGMYFSVARGRELEFSVSVAHPEMADGDDIPLKLTVDSQRGVDIRLDDVYDIVSEREQME